MIERKALELLQFEKVSDHIKRYCVSEKARALCEGLVPESDAKRIVEELKRTFEVKSLMDGGGFFPSLEHPEIEDELLYLEKDGSFLDATQLLAVMHTSGVYNALLRFLKTKRTASPLLAAEIAGLTSCPEIEDRISAILDSDAQIKDTASAELHNIRKQIREKKRESDRLFYHYVAQLRKQGYLRENEESYFNGRRTLAVPVEHRSEVSGLVHGKSESGKTIFIEPGITMPVNNAVSELEMDERREVIRILRELCSSLRSFVPALKAGCVFLGYIDFLKAKALFAIDTHSTLPRLNQGFRLELHEARHPLLYLQNVSKNKKTVPLDIVLNEHERIVLISGPNAGGKTVALKTVGLLQVMLQAGLLVPVREDSSFSFFENVLVDIGDTQSIENELSTYSARLRSMISILEQVNNATLVLMDEFGSGTDPQLGGAIAEVVLESLVRSGTKGIVTSHFGNIKLLAGRLEGVSNASMLFDIESFEPLYKLSLGEPGSSYTFEVAERIGFPRHLIESAKKRIDSDKLDFNTLLAELQDQKARLHEQHERMEHEEFLSRLAKEKYNSLSRTWENKLNEQRSKRMELARLAAFGQKYLRLMTEWKETRNKKEVIKKFIDGLTAETKKQETLLRQNRVDTFTEKKIAYIKKNLSVGSPVTILNGRQVGTVEEIKDEKVIVRMGLHRMTVGMQNLDLVEKRST